MKTITLSDEQITMLSSCIIAQMQSNDRASELVIDAGIKANIQSNNNELKQLFVTIND